jgi:hypothetical protein
VSVGWSARCFCGSKITASAGLVLDHNGLAECGFQMFGQEPGRQIGASSCWKRHNNDNRSSRPKRIGRRLREAWNRGSLSGCGESKD